jgi:hypothetical protein
MATKEKIMCPFNKKMVCRDCILYRGRHSSCGSKARNDANDLEALKKIMNPDLITAATEDNIDVKVTYINLDDDIAREMNISELKDLNWNEIYFIKTINGIQIKSWEDMLQTLKFKEQEGRKSVELVDSPAHMG